MRRPLVVAFELDGFKHDLEPFTLKSIAVACDPLELASAWTLQTSHLASRPAPNLLTYACQTVFEHGFQLMSPGIPQELLAHTVSHMFNNMFFESFEMPSLHPDHFMAFVKGQEKLDLLQQAVLDVPCMLPVVFRDLDAFGCPPADQLAIDVPEGEILTTRYKAINYSIWLANNGLA